MNTQTLSGPIASKNVGEEFIRIDELGANDGPFLSRKTGFLSIKEGTYDEAIDMIKTGKRQVKLTSQTKNGVYNVQLINPAVAVEQPEGTAANPEVTLEHK